MNRHIDRAPSHEYNANAPESYYEYGEGMIARMKPVLEEASATIGLGEQYVRDLLHPRNDQGVIHEWNDTPDSKGYFGTVVHSVEVAQLAAMSVLDMLTDPRHPEYARSIEEVCEKARFTKNEFVAMVTIGAALHDIGKLVSPETNRLINEPRALMPEERKTVSAHPSDGAAEFIHTYHHDLDSAGKKDRAHTKIALGIATMIEKHHGTPLPEDAAQYNTYLDKTFGVKGALAVEHLHSDSLATDMEKMAESDEAFRQLVDLALNILRASDEMLAMTDAGRNYLTKNPNNRLFSYDEARRIANEGEVDGYEERNAAIARRANSLFVGGITGSSVVTIVGHQLPRVSSARENMNATARGLQVAGDIGGFAVGKAA